MNRKLLKASLAAPIALALTAGGVALAAGPTPHEAKPHSFDPAHTMLVSSGWINGIGCPTSAATSSDGIHQNGTYADAGCPTGDPKDNKNQGLLLSKEGPTTNYAAGQVEIKDVKGVTLTELGYDIRKPNSQNDGRGSHCGAGAPRFDIVYSDGSVDETLGCSIGSVANSGPAWQRLRFTPPATPAGLTVSGLFIVYDEGTDTGPDNFGMAVLDNIDVNGTLIGQGDHGDAS